METALANWRYLLSTPDQADGEEAPSELVELIRDSKTRFNAAMADDFNTAMALGVLYELIREVNKWALAESFKLTATNRPVLAEALSVLQDCGDLLGIWFTGEEATPGLSDAEIQELVEKRQAARANRDYKTADAIRDTLKAKGIILEDTPQGVRWKRV
mgnify:FL=1